MHPGSGGEARLPLAVAALGGGHGLHASLSALRHVVEDLTAVVTVADNGGSSGRLRGEFGVLPPGDLRMALAALCGDDDWGQTWARTLQHRFAGTGDMNGHVIGNLLIVGLWELLGDPVEALDWVGRLLGAEGRVLPMALTPLDVVAEVRGGDPARPGDTVVVRGQVEVATATGRIVGIDLEPRDPPACAAAVAAVAAGDWVVLGPGSWFTSVIPHLMVPELREAIVGTSGRVLVALNLGVDEETGGFSAEDHLAALFEHAAGLGVHTILVDDGTVTGRRGGLESLEKFAADHGAHLVAADVAAAQDPLRHDPVKLAAAYRQVFAGQP